MRNLYFVYLGSRYDEDWRWSVSHHYRQKGYSIVNSVASNDGAAQPVVFNLYLNEVGNIPADATVYLFCTNEVLLSSSAVSSLGNDIDSRLSLIAAFVADAANMGWSTIDATDHAHELPYVGTISRGSNGDSDASIVANISGRIRAYSDYLDQSKIVWDWDQLQVIGGAIHGLDLNIDLTGRARVLVYGPYVAIPSGVWRCTVPLATAVVGANPKVSFEWGASEHFTTLDLEAIANQPQVAVIEHEFQFPQIAELRVLLMEPVFHATLSAQRPILTRVPR